jgi:UDP-N-acetylmuramoyl-L-alanyl-D-glutamate--2,6-diaminopimelate ligase
MMRLVELIDNLPVDLRRGTPRVAVSAVTEDSREVGPGALFVARPGVVTDGRRFVADAIERGAVAVLTSSSAAETTDVGAGVAHLTAPDVAAAAGLLAERLHDHPSRRLALVGVTGTNGKTTVAWLARGLLATAGARCGLVGTVAIDAGTGLEPATLTTPGATVISPLLARMVAAGCRAAVIEASSHALEQRRTAGLEFAGAVFTNLSGDHLDYHGTMDAYAAAKARLFDGLAPGAWAVVNGDDPATATVTGACPARCVETSLETGSAGRDAARAAIAQATITGTAVAMSGPWGRFEVVLPLLGRHNVANALQAAVVGHELGLDADALRAGLAGATAPPGRLEPVTPPDAPFQVLVDYAHTDDALDNVLRGLRPLLAPGARLVVVFGCGGDRDRTKRPRMAAAAARWADAIVATSDNPRTEDPERILDDVMPGIPTERRAATTREADRAEAIRVAIEQARPGDVVVIAGKGHETEQIVGAERRPFDDRDVARTVLDTSHAAVTG